MPESMAGRLRARREQLGLSRKKLAALLRTDQSNVAGWETEKHRPTKKSREIMGAFLMSNDLLLFGQVGHNCLRKPSLEACV